MTSVSTQSTARARTRRLGGTPWPEARLVAAQAARLAPVRLPLGDALGRVLAADLVARNHLPPSDNSAMDGWAVSGAPPWRIVSDNPASRVSAQRLRPGQCARIATGATVPDGTDAVLPVEDSVRDRDRSPTSQRPDAGVSSAVPHPRQRRGGTQW